VIKKEIVVTSFDVDAAGFARPSALLRYMQQAAREDLDQFGMTYPQMRENGVVFVLYGIRMELSRPLKAYEKLSLETYSVDIRGASFQRDFYAFSDGKEVMRATSKWVLLDFVKRSIAHPSRLGVELPRYLDKDSGLTVDKRLDLSGTVHVMDRTVYQSMLDENEHLNNCVYADIVTDCLEYDLKKYVSSIEILFHHEAAPGDELSLEMKGEGDSRVVCASDVTKDRPCFSATVTRRDA